MLSLGNPSLDASYDRWKTTPSNPKSKFTCDQCGASFFPGDRVYNIEGENLCNGCASSWIESQWHFAEDEQCYGD